MKVNFTQQRVMSELVCEVGKSQTLHQDANTPGLGLRVTAGGARSFIFEARLHGKTVRVTIGDVKAWKLDVARTEASRLRVLVDGGKDPREESVAQAVAHAARKAEAARKTATLAEAWAVYTEARRSKWSELHYRDHVDLSQLGGVPKLRGKGLTAPGPLAPLMGVKLADLTADRVADWLADEADTRPARARKAFDLLRIFAGWADEQPQYTGLVDSKAVSAKLRKELPKPSTKDDVLQREQLTAWFAAVRQLDNPVMEAYLQGLLLTGARREELAGLKWGDVDFKWNSLHLADKVEAAGRTIPLTPYFKTLLLKLKAINDTPPTVRALREQFERRGETWRPSEFVFASKTSGEGRLTSPNRALARVCAIAGVPHVTLHGLRRSFATLSEWCELPVGVTAQIQGHKPSATAEKHYKRRPLDLLRSWHDKLETWLLEQAGIDFQPAAAEQKPPMPKAV
ncbi:preprotein translocase [Paraburkholderia monticola]|uniref:Preprotein translocase n=1 Tax=Paraburkholderia monticola TaxID=1399968 RepID=A0A149Q195_9BURK|nr:integrase family protein [Paraburkholderia monticola]KXU91085.1 preprotein translocase [Paraburkholderia monticola]